MDGFALAHLDIDIERFEDEGIITEGDRITQKVIDVAEGERFSVVLERCTDPNFVRYRDPLTGSDVTLPAKHARLWKVDLNWLREEIITVLGTGLLGVRGKHQEDEPIFLGELDIDGQAVALYFAARMSNDRQFAQVDAALRLHPRSVPGIVLTTASAPFPFAGTNLVIAIDEVLATTGQETAPVCFNHHPPARHAVRNRAGAVLQKLQRLRPGHAWQIPVETQDASGGDGCLRP